MNNFDPASIILAARKLEVEKLCHPDLHKRPDDGRGLANYTAVIYREPNWKNLVRW